MTLHQKKRSEERVEALEKSDKEVNNLKAKASALEDGTTQILIKFQDELAVKEAELSEAHASIASLKQDMAKQRETSAAEIAKLT